MDYFPLIRHEPHKNLKKYGGGYTESKIPSKLGGGENTDAQTAGNFINLLTKISGDTRTDGRTQTCVCIYTRIPFRTETAK
jgi:hypothetical protein